MASTSAKRAAKRNKREEEPAGGVSRVAGTSKAATVQKKQTFSVKEAKRMLEESDIDDLHCEELDSSTQSSDDGDNVNDTQTESDEPPTQASKRPKMSKKRNAKQQSMFVFSKTYVPICHNLPQSNEEPGPKDLGNIDSTSTALDIFSLFWTDDVWNTFTDMTNLRATQTLQANPNDYYAKLWSPLSVEEVKAFFAVRLSMEYAVIRPRYESYWYQKKEGILFQTPGYRKYFTRDRFLAIWRFLHYIDEESRDKDDKLYKVRPLINKLISGFQQHYILDKDLSLDEGVIPTKNRLGFKQYLKDKPVKWGIKTYMLCESKSGYVYNLEVYTGKSNNDASYINDPEIGATGNVVYRLVRGFENQGFTVYMDRFYTSPILYKFLSDKGIDACGTVVTNRKHFPVEIIRKKKELKRGESIYVAAGNLSAVTWMDRRPIYFMSTCHDPSETTVVKRHEKSGESIEVTCPIAVACYNRNMGGCDRNDQMAKLHRSRRHYRWPRRLVMKCLLWSAYNAYIIKCCLKNPVQPGRRARTFLGFCDNLILQLIGTYCSPAGHRGRSSVDGFTRLQNVGCHFPERPPEATRNNTCVVCRTKFSHFAKKHPSVRRADNPHSMTVVFR